MREFGTGTAVQDFRFCSIKIFLIFDLSMKLGKPRKQPTHHSRGSEICPVDTQDKRPYFCLLGGFA